MSNIDFTLTDFEQFKSYMQSEKRIITWDGDTSDEVMNMTDDVIYFHGFTGCFLSIISSNITCQDMEMQYLYQWVKEEKKVMVLKLNDNNHVVCYAILHETDYDPLKQQKNPFIMDYIYTYEPYRNLGYAKSLINTIKNNYEFTAFCNSEVSAWVFGECGCRLIQAYDEMVIARTQPRTNKFN